MPFFFLRKDGWAILYRVHSVARTRVLHTCGPQGHPGGIAPCAQCGTHTRAPHLRSSTLLAPGTGFVEDDFCTDQGEGAGLGWFKRITFIVFSISLIITLWYIMKYNSPQCRIRPSGIRFSWRERNLDPSHMRFTGGFALLWESDASAGLTGARAQEAMWALGSGCKYGWSLARPLTTQPPAGQASS